MKRIVILSDWHVGSYYAVAPPNFRIPHEGGGYSRLELSALGKALYRSWRWLANEWYGPELLFCLGEPIDGPNRKESGGSVWTSNVLAQLDAAKELFDMWGAKTSRCVRGSNYHVTTQEGAVNAEELWGKMIGATKYNYQYAPARQFVRVEDVILDFAHHLGNTTVPQYRSAAITREMFLSYVNASHNHKADIVCRGHVHFFWNVNSAGHSAFTSPAWKTQDWYQQQKSPAGAIPDIGAIRITIDGDKWDWEQHIFAMPELKPPLARL